MKLNTEVMIGVVVSSIIYGAIIATIIITLMAPWR